MAPKSKKRKTDDTAGQKASGGGNPKKRVAAAAAKILPQSVPEKLGDRILSCGVGIAGQLGTLREQDKKPRKLHTFPDGVNKFRQIAAGGMHSVALTEDGRVYTWGCNDEGPLGRVCPDGKDEDGKPGLVDFGVGNEEIKIAQVVAGATFTAALTEQGSVFGWGGFRNNSRNVGLSIVVEKGKFGQATQRTVPKKNEPTLIFDQRKEREAIVKLSAGENHLCLLTEKGRLLTMGASDNGQLGRFSERMLERPDRSLKLGSVAEMRHLGLKKYTNVWAGAYFTFASGFSEKKKKCVLVAWGVDKCRQLGLEAPEAEEEERRSVIALPQEASRLDQVLPEGSEWKELCGDQHVLALTSCGKLFGLGRNDDYILGLGNEEPQERPIQIRFNQDNDLNDAAGISAATKASFCWTKRGHGFAWGNNNDGELGLGLDDDSRMERPEKIRSKHLEDPDAEPPTKFKIIQISASGQHTLFLAKDVS